MFSICIVGGVSECIPCPSWPKLFDRGPWEGKLAPRILDVPGAANSHMTYKRNDPRGSVPPYSGGDVVIANLFNGIENPGSTGKPRPLVLLRTKGASWRAIGLTSRARYGTSGEARIAVPNPGAVGLWGPGYVFSPRPCWVNQIDIDRVIGHVDTPLAEVLLEFCLLDDHDRNALIGSGMEAA